MPDIDDLNSGYASALLEEYLENPEAVPAEWRALFESGRSELAARLPGLQRLLEVLGADGNGHVRAPVAALPPEVDETLLDGVAAATELVRAIRMHGHLAAHLDPLGAEPIGDPAL